MTRLGSLGHTLLRIIYHMLSHKHSYIEHGNDYLEQWKMKRDYDREAMYIRQLEAKGYTVKPA